MVVVLVVYLIMSYRGSSIPIMSCWDGSISYLPRVAGMVVRAVEVGELLPRETGNVPRITPRHNAVCVTRHEQVLQALREELLRVALFGVKANQKQSETRFNIVHNIHQEIM